MIIIKNKVAIEKMRTAGQLLAEVFAEIPSFLEEGKNTAEIDLFVEQKMLQKGLKPECKGYGGYRHATLISPNDVVVHGIPSKNIILKNGDFVKIDVVGAYRGYCADMARYYFIGNVPPIAQKLAEVAQRALDEAIGNIGPGVKLSDVSSRIQKIVEGEGFGVVRDFAGHGIGKRIHEEPDVPNYATGVAGPLLREGMTLAIEPMITQGDYKVLVLDDGWTVKTADGGLAAHVEDTIAITSHGAEVFTRLY